MTVTYYKDNRGTEHQFAQEPDEGGGVRPIAGVPSPIAALFSNMSTRLTAIAAAVAGTLTVGLPSGAATSAAQTAAQTTLSSILSALGAALTVNLPSGASTSANQSTGNSSLSTIASNTTGVATAANQSTGNSSLSTIASNTTGVSTAANQTTGNSSLSTLVTANHPTSGHTGQTAIGTTHAAVGSQSCSNGAWVKNMSPGTEKMYIRYAADGNATSTAGYYLNVGDEHFFPCTNVSDLDGISDGAAGRVAWRTE